MAGMDDANNLSSRLENDLQGDKRIQFSFKKKRYYHNDYMSNLLGAIR